VNDDRAMELLKISSWVRTLASGRFGLTDQTASRTSLRRSADPTRVLRKV